VAGTRDNAVGCVARLLLASHPATPLVPLDAVLPSYLRALPPKEDWSEAHVAYRALCHLLAHGARVAVASTGLEYVLLCVVLVGGAHAYRALRHLLAHGARVAVASTGLEYVLLCVVLVGGAHAYRALGATSWPMVSTRPYQRGRGGKCCADRGCAAGMLASMQGGTLWTPLLL